MTLKTTRKQGNTGGGGDTLLGNPLVDIMQGFMPADHFGGGSPIEITVKLTSKPAMCPFWRHLGGGSPV